MAPGTSFANSPACNHCRAIGHRLSWNRLWKYAKWPISVTPISSGLMRKCVRELALKWLSRRSMAATVPNGSSLRLMARVLALTEAKGRVASWRALGSCP